MIGFISITQTGIAPRASEIMREFKACCCYFLSSRDEIRIMMDADEREIFYYLRKEREVFIPASAISRHAGGKHKFRDSPDWAKQALLRMAERGILEVDPVGAYRLKPIPAPVQNDNTRRWVSPQIAEMLRKSGKQFDGVIRGEVDEEAYYDSL